VLDLDYPKNRYEIIVVDNDSNDGCLKEVKELFEKEKEQPLQTSSLLKKLEPELPPLITIQAPGNDGFSVGNNLGIKKSNSRYVLVMNPDIAVVPEALERLVLKMDEDRQIGILGPKLINPDGSIQDSCRRFPNFLVPVYRRTILGKAPFAKKTLDHYLMGDWNHQKSTTVDWIFGAALMIRKSAIEKIGVFDERFFMYFEDLDLCRRCWEAGFKVYYYTDVEMVHYHQRLSANRSGILGIFKKAGRIHIISGIKYFIKYFGTRLPKRSN
jgi:GT2 family glycosyltransferase